jgi:D,D-heptose 1,7-bisphosphate phosphatase
MANKAVFLDRDHTIMEDPGYLSDPSAVKLLPGVELALRSLAQAGYKLVVVTNQSGVARGLLTEHALEGIHEELKRQLGQKGASLDGIYYCPYHPEGTVEAYAIDSDLRKPKPGMLLKAAADLDIDLSASWMVGDSARDVEAGQRAGCRTVRLRATAEQHGEQADEDVQADYNARNLVDAARLILRGVAPAAVLAPAAQAGEDASGAPPAAPASHSPPGEEFSLRKFIAALLQMLAAMALLIGLGTMLYHQMAYALYWTMFAMVLQAMTVTAILGQRDRRH